MNRAQLIGFGIASKRPVRMHVAGSQGSPPPYGSSAWMRAHVQAGNRPVGVVGGLVIDHVAFVGLAPAPAGRRGVLCKVIGGSAEHPTVIQVTPEELRRAVWTISRPGERQSGTGLAIIGGQGIGSQGIGADEAKGPGATPWIAGGILVGLAVALKAAEVKTGGASVGARMGARS